ncbi:sigma-54-dependent Fis family transcriptional regulator [Pseudoroseomonas deserti]|uniref:Sigma-54-dependent Fis family transcriptional regulator n=1 Tax=Teichococcus deserti TaxID=1817963 RepID=A0A1V2H5P2_9PROT|nr:sigma-54 dependent transcriptional regulator [Pseudoroseomonas deserti]ONG55267.1 sigma-54-dependent Fis family transcriptional regulator [Pseudoroseomonas deserti]
MPRVLIVGPLAGELGLAARMAQARGARVAQVEGVTSALAKLRAEGADVVMCEVHHDIDWLVRAMLAERILCPVIACGVDAAAETAVRAIRAGARDFLPLPPDADLIAAMLQAAAGEQAEEAAPPAARDPVMAAVLARADQVARAEASVLITGESGTGKEVMARRIHAGSRRASGPFVALNCAALPESLLESELFGHEKGAFSGAVAGRKGKFEQAEGGTLLLDEIGEMDPRLQAKLLRALQEREIDRLGSTRPIKVDVRILAATNRDLMAEVRAGRFREDLYFRLDVVRLRLPPLRERPGDILPLADLFAARFAEVNGLPPRSLDAAARRALLAYSWPGNVRELENALHRAVLMAEGDAIGAEAIELARPDAAAGVPVTGLTPAAAAAAFFADPPRPAPMPQPPLPTPAELAAAAATAAAPAYASYGAVVPQAPAPAAQQLSPEEGIAALVGRRMEDVERDLILGTLAHCLGNRTRAAEVLGISIRALRNKLQDYRASGLAVTAPGGAAAAE